MTMRKWVAIGGKRGAQPDQTNLRVLPLTEN